MAISISQYDGLTNGYHPEGSVMTNLKAKFEENPSLQILVKVGKDWYYLAYDVINNEVKVYSTDGKPAKFDVDELLYKAFGYGSKSKNLNRVLGGAFPKDQNLIMISKDTKHGYAVTPMEKDAEPKAAEPGTETVETLLGKNSKTVSAEKETAEMPIAPDDLEDEAAAPKSPVASKPGSSAPAVSAGYDFRQINSNVMMTWKDAGDQKMDHKIDLAKGEHKTVKFFYTDPLTHETREIKVATGLTNQFASLLDANGVAGSLGIHDNMIDDDGFKALGDLISFWVGQKNVYGDDALLLEVFNDKSAIFYDVTKAAINEACSTIQGWFEHVEDLHDAEAVGKVLEEKNSGGKIINDIVLSYIRGHKDKNISAEEIADLALRCFVARQTGKHELLHINEKIDTTIETPAWQNLTAAKLLAWFRGEAVSNEDDGKSGSGASDDDYRKALGKSDYKEAEKVTHRMKKGAIKDNSLKQLSGFALEESDQGKKEDKLNKAIALADEMSDSNEKWSMLVKIASECFKSRDSEETRKKSLELLQQVLDKAPAYRPEGALLQELSRAGLNVKEKSGIGALHKLAEEELRTPLEILKKKELVLKDGEITLENAGAALAELDKITGAERPFALLAKAEILKAQADDLWKEGAGNDAKAPNKPAIAKYKEMAQTAQLAAKGFRTLSQKAAQNSKDQLYYNDKFVHAQSITGRIIEEKAKVWMPKSGTGVRPDPNKDKYRKDFAEIGKYILKGTTLMIAQEQGAKEWTSAQFKLFYLDLKKDNELQALGAAADKEKAPKKEEKLAKHQHHAPVATPDAKTTPSGTGATTATGTPAAAANQESEKDKKGKKNKKNEDADKFAGLNPEDIKIKL